MILPYHDITSRLIFESIQKENKHCCHIVLLATVRRSHDNRIFASEQHRPRIVNSAKAVPIEIFLPAILLCNFVQYDIRLLGQTPHQLNIMDVAIGAASRDVLVLIIREWSENYSYSTQLEAEPIDATTHRQTTTIEP